MNILAIESSSDQCVLVLRVNGQLFTYSWGEARSHSATILRYINDLLEKAAMTVSKLNAIGVGCGPGSFTGVRLAISVAQGLAYAHHIPVIAVNSLAVLAQTVYLQAACQRVIVAVNARQGECYVGEFLPSAQKIMQACGDVVVKSTVELSAIQDLDIPRVGNGFLNLKTLKHHRDRIDILPTGQALMMLVEAKTQQMPSGINPMDLRANYVLTNLYQPKDK